MLRAVSKDELLLQAKVSGFGGKPTVATKLTDGKRAASIRINDVNGVAGFVLPGDRVDILLTRELGDDQKDLVTDIILQGIVVIGIDQLTEPIKVEGLEPKGQIRGFNPGPEEVRGAFRTPLFR